MTNIIIENQYQDYHSPTNSNYLVTEYINIEKRKKRFEKKEDNLDISPKTLVGNSLAVFSDLQINELSQIAKKTLKKNSKLVLLDDISNNSKSTNTNFLAYSNQLSGNLENLVINKSVNVKKKRVTFRDELRITNNNQGNYKLNNMRLPLVDVIEVESYKKYNLPLEEINYNNNERHKNSFKRALKNLSCQALNNPCCVIF